MNARAWPVLSIIEMTEFSLLLFVIIGRNGMVRQGETARVFITYGLLFSGLLMPVKRQGGYLSEIARGFHYVTSGTPLNNKIMS